MEFLPNSVAERALDSDAKADSEYLADADAAEDDPNVLSAAW